EEDGVDVVAALLEQRVEDPNGVRLVVVECDEDHAQATARRRSTEVDGLLVSGGHRAGELSSRRSPLFWFHTGGGCQLPNWRKFACWCRASAAPAREPVAQLHEKLRIALDAVLPLHQRLPAVHLAAHDADPDAVGRVHGEIRTRRHALEALAAPP